MNAPQQEKAPRSWRQFPLVDCSRGAPMGRSSYGAARDCAPRSVRLFRVRLDSGGYDDGGAYWGFDKWPLWCAMDRAGYRDFIRAPSVVSAMLKLRLEPFQLKQSRAELKAAAAAGGAE